MNSVSQQVLYKVYISFVEVGPGNVQTVDYFKGIGKRFLETLLLIEEYFNVLFINVKRAFLCHSLVPYCQYWRNFGGSYLCCYFGLYHSFYQEGSHHRASVCLPAGLPGVPDGRTVFSLCYSFVSITTFRIGLIF